MNENNSSKDIHGKRIQNKHTLKIATTAIFIAVGLVLSYLNFFAYFTIMDAKIFPFAHMINALTGVLIGLPYTAVVALGIASFRYPLGIGSIHAFHGGISGAIVVGIAAYYVRRKKPKYVDLVAFLEPLGTVFIGATIAYLIAPIYPIYIWWFLFAASCIPGCILGYLMLIILRKAGISHEDFFLDQK